MLRRIHQVPTSSLRRTTLQSTTHRGILSTASATRRTQCPKCHSTLPTPLPACPKCSYISRVPSNIKYHGIFDLPSTDNPFKIDDKQLTRRFRKLQQTIHPDAWSAKGEAESSAAADLSSLVNHAFKTLQSPVLRAEYILREQGIDLAESEQTLEDPELLMEIMESREALDEATSQEQVDLIVSKTQDAMSKTMQEVEEQCEKYRWGALQTSAVRLRYLQNILAAAKAWTPS